MTDTPHIAETPTAEITARWTLQNAFYAAGLATIIVSGIYFGEPILMPVALAVLLAFALAPLVARLRIFGLGRVPSVMVTVLLAIVVIGALGTYIFTEIGELAHALPRYESNIAHKINSLRSAAEGNSFYETASAVLQRLDNDLSTAEKPAAKATSAPKPVLVELTSQQTTPIHIVESIAGPLLEPLATVFIVAIFVIFMLLQKEDLRDRFIRLAGSADLRRTTVALDDGATRLSRYLLMQTTINTCFGILVGTGLWLIGIPNAGLWGLTGAMFRFVPYVGVPVAAAVPMALAFAIDPDWWKVFETLLLYLAIEPVLGQFVEPVVYGRSIGLSATAVVVAATFWTWVWGPVGLLLSTPLTMCLVVIGRHVDQLRFLDVLLGDRPPLAMEEGLYLRILGNEPDEAAHQAEEFLEKNSLSAYYDEVVVKALVMAQADARHGTLDRDRRHTIRMAVEGLMQNLSERGDDTKPADPQGYANGQANEEWNDNAVLCVAGPGPLDEVASLLLADLLSRHNIGARIISHADALPVNIERLDKTGVRLVAVCYLEPANFTNARYLVRRLNRHFPQAKLLLNFWGFGTDDTRYLDAIEATGCELIATTLREAVERVLFFAKHKGLDAALDREGVMVA
ncbi:MAG TPA: AI-2E family transporter [Rhizomicrobium sp.]|nr:AI-2E family transporter [Rhizomicrobium sp.]